MDSLNGLQIELSCFVVVVPPSECLPLNSVADPAVSVLLAEVILVVFMASDCEALKGLLLGETRAKSEVRSELIPRMPAPAEIIESFVWLRLDCSPSIFIAF